MTGTAIRPFWWPWALLAAAAALVLGGWLHRQEDEALHGLVRTGAWLGDPAWVPSHLMLLSAEILLIVGLYGLVTAHQDLSASARRAGWATLVAVALWVVEGVPHVLSAGDAHAVSAGHPTPFFSGFQRLAPLVYPIIGLSVAALAALAGRRLTHPVFVVAGVVGGGADALAPLLEGVGGINELDVLYALGLLIAVWFVSRRSHRAAPAIRQTEARPVAPVGGEQRQLGHDPDQDPDRTDAQRSTDLMSNVGTALRP